MNESILKSELFGNYQFIQDTNAGVCLLVNISCWIMQPCSALPPQPLDPSAVLLQAYKKKKKKNVLSEVLTISGIRDTREIFTLIYARVTFYYENWL